MTFYCNGEPLGRVDDIELDGVDIANAKVWKDETFTAEVDTSGWSKKQWQAIFGLIPIIRCEYCRYFAENDMCVAWHQYTVKHGFCHWAERKVENERK